jgi:alkanesulfonate monooxygenase SsuD/methylene tetrahydromethanopterin reductase-like flavin-dependent oxidoreductase (luciferase family)
LTQPLKIGVLLRFKNPEPWAIGWEKLYKDHLKYATAVDRLGFDGIWVAEHHCVPSGYNPAPFVALTAIAGATRRCKIGTQPLLLPLYNPVLVAEQAAAVDIFSGGRLVLCVATGYRDGDFEAVGIARNERGARSEEALGVLVRALRGEAFDHHGRFYVLQGVQLSPLPLQRPVKLQLAARSAPAVSRALRHGVDVNVFAPETALELSPTFRDEAAKYDRKLRDIGVSFHASGFLAGSRTEAVEASKAYQLWQAREFEGNAGGDVAEVASARRMIDAIEKGKGAYTAGEWIEKVQADCATIAKTGMRADWLNVTLWHSGMPVEQAIDCLEQFAAEVLPHITAPAGSTAVV